MRIKRKGGRGLVDLGFLRSWHTIDAAAVWCRLSDWAYCRCLLSAYLTMVRHLFQECAP